MSKPFCYIYRSSNKAGMYLYLHQKDDFAPIPDALMQQFGTAEFSMVLELKADRKLANADASTVLEMLKSQGYYLQLPPPDPWLQDPENLATKNSLLPR